MHSCTPCQCYRGRGPLKFVGILDQGSRAKVQHVSEEAHRAEKDEDEDSAADAGAQHEVREKLDAGIAAALETLELGTHASGSQVDTVMPAWPKLLHTNII